tara:strand:- start:7001 stop:7237 length:237 start_codon:yes stop_codon:yes gene_type:complete
MKNNLALVWNVLLIVMGCSLLGWIAFNLFVEMQPEAEGKNPLVPTLVGLLLVGTGGVRIVRRFRSQGVPDEPETDRLD